MKITNERMIDVVMKLFMIKVVLLLLTPLLMQIGISSTSGVTILLYLLIMINAAHVQIRYNYFSRKDLLVLCLVAVFFFLNYLLFPANRQQYGTIEMILNYVFYIPLSIVFIPKVNDWTYFFVKGQRFAVLAIVFIIPIFGLSLTGYLNYMEFAYSVLPLGAIAAINAGNSMDMKRLLTFFAYIVIMLSFGARGPILFLVLTFVFAFLLNKNVGKKMLVIVPLLVIGVLFISAQAFQEALIRYANSTGSYVLINIIQGDMFKSQTRNLLYQHCREYIYQQGLFSYNGLFGDRAVCAQLGWPYSHSIIYESIISFGWIFGVLFLGIILISMIRVFIKSDLSHKYMLIYICLALLGRFFMSGTFVVEGRFYLFLGILVSLHRIWKRRNKEVMK